MFTDLLDYTPPVFGRVKVWGGGGRCCLDGVIQGGTLEFHCTLGEKKSLCGLNIIHCCADEALECRERRMLKILLCIDRIGHL